MREKEDKMTGNHSVMPGIRKQLKVHIRKADRLMEFKKCKEKYFIIVEGEERAAIRKSEAAAEKKRKSLEKYSSGKKVLIYKAVEKSGE